MRTHLKIFTPAAIVGLSFAVAGGALAQDQMPPQPPEPIDQQDPMDPTRSDQRTDPMNDQMANTPTNRATQASPTLTPEQKAEMDAWPASQKESYQTWPTEVQTYYWSLSPARQSLFWRLRDQDKRAIIAMTPEQQEQSWRTLEAQTTGTAPQG